MGCSWNVLLCPIHVEQIGMSSLQIIHCNWLLAVYMPLWKNMCLSCGAGPVIVYFTQVILLRIKLSDALIKLAIAGDFSSPHF